MQRSYGTVRYIIVRYSTVQYSTVLYSTLQYSTVKDGRILNLSTLDNSGRILNWPAHPDDPQGIRVASVIEFSVCGSVCVWVCSGQIF